jgi:hypothetical protein
LIPTRAIERFIIERFIIERFIGEAIELHVRGESACN